MGQALPQAVTTERGTESAYLATAGGRIVGRMVFWSDVDDLITVDDTAGAEVFPPVTVADVPSGATFLHVYAGVVIGQFEDTSTAENKVVLAGSEHIQVKETAAGAFVDAIKLLAGQWLTPASGTRGGGVFIGNIDIKAEVDANDPYSFQWEGADVTGASLLLRDVQSFLIVEFTT